MIKTTSLETSKELKTQGFRQDTEKVWLKLEKQEPLCLADKDFLDIHIGNEWYAAPTTDEILEELPSLVPHKEMGDCFLYLVKWNDDYYYASYTNPKIHTSSCGLVGYRDKNPSEALALLWLYLKKEGLNGRS